MQRKTPDEKTTERSTTLHKSWRKKQGRSNHWITAHCLLQYQTSAEASAARLAPAVSKTMTSRDSLSHCTSVNRTGQDCSQLSFLDVRQRLLPQKSSGNLDVNFLLVFCCFSVLLLVGASILVLLGNAVIPRALWTLGDVQAFSFFCFHLERVLP